MEQILNQLNYTVTSCDGNGKKISLLVINNRNGSPRWIMNAKANKPHFLKFYAVNNLRSALFSMLLKFIFFLRLQTLIFKTKKFNVYNSNANNNLDLHNTNWAVFAGTTGEYNKILLYQIVNGFASFTKIATNFESKFSIENEVNSLNTLCYLQPQTFYIPNIIAQSDNYIQTEDISYLSKRQSAFGALHQNFVAEMYEKTSVQVSFEHLNICLSIQDNFEKIKDNRIASAMMRKMQMLINSCKHNVLEVSMAHGDFTPWNCFVIDDKLAIYDWELSAPLMPIGFDAFHFIIQNGILVERKSWKEIKLDILKAIDINTFATWQKCTNNSIETYMKYYLLVNTINCLKLLSKQSKWHQQVYWLLNTWNEAISDVLQHDVCNRELVIMDAFNYLHNIKYAAIKFNNAKPEKISELSDIDLCIDKKNALQLQKYLQNHPLIVHSQALQKSFMSSMQLVTKTGNFLSLDLIWTFKRKNIVMLNAQDILNKYYVNDYGVKMMDLINLTRYIGLFYGLNKQPIPTKFGAYEQIIANSNEPIDRILFSNYLDGTNQQAHLYNELKKQPENKYFSYLINCFNYVLDCIKSFKNNKGLVITFSGVDGAGKSTIIEKSKFEIEKRLRKKVIVLRHRPSILPILSVYSKGKKAAMALQESESKLPRQGTNNSQISSLFRFAYYLFDYVLGQFYIYAKHTAQGTVVLYDRYYFDFIIDSKRSNINLPQGVAKFFYKFIFKPDLNFFLFADATTILKRKQELNAETIQELTAKYQLLFSELQLASDAKNQQYFVIENIDLQETINTILLSTKTLAA